MASGALLLAHVLASFFRQGFFRDAAAWGAGLKHVAATLDIRSCRENHSRGANRLCLVLSLFGSFGRVAFGALKVVLGGDAGALAARDEQFLP